MRLVLPALALWVVLPLAGGAAIYAWAKPGVWFLAMLAAWGMPLPAPAPPGIVATMLAERAPDALWAFAFVAFLVLVWFRGGESGPTRLALGCLGGIYETGQGLGMAPGRFDWVDLGVSVAAGLTAAVLIRRKRPKGRGPGP